MNMAALIVLGLALAAGVDEGKQEAVKKDREQMQGHWTLVSQVVDGEEKTEAPGTKITIDADGNATAEKEGMPTRKAKLTIDPSKTPKTIDVEFQEGEQKGQTVQGIYEINGDTFRVCRSAPGKDRPTEFTSKQGTGCGVTTYKRDKP
jgi:uncharacterized protein (TIGR03067 family)